MLISPFAEVRYYGQMAYEELMRVSPNFLQNVDGHHGEIARDYRRKVSDMSMALGKKYGRKVKKNKANSEIATLIDYDRDTDIKVASEIIFSWGRAGISKKDIIDWAKDVKKREGKSWSPTLLSIMFSSFPARNVNGRSRRQKLSRAFEHAQFEVELFTDIGA